MRYILCVSWWTQEPLDLREGVTQPRVPLPARPPGQKILCRIPSKNPWPAKEVVPRKSCLFTLEMRPLHRNPPPFAQHKVQHCPARGALAIRAPARPRRICCHRSGTCNDVRMPLLSCPGRCPCNGECSCSMPASFLGFARGRAARAAVSFGPHVQI